MTTRQSENLPVNCDSYLPIFVVVNAGKQLALMAFEQRSFHLLAHKSLRRMPNM